jgi:hypothetical protein
VDRHCRRPACVSSISPVSGRWSVQQADRVPSVATRPHEDDRKDEDRVTGHARFRAQPSAGQPAGTLEARDHGPQEEREEPEQLPSIAQTARVVPDQLAHATSTPGDLAKFGGLSSGVRERGFSGTGPSPWADVAVV